MLVEFMDRGLPWKKGKVKIELLASFKKRFMRVVVRRVESRKGK